MIYNLDIWILVQLDPIYTVSQTKKVAAFKLYVTLSGFQNFYTAEKRMKFATKVISHYPPHLGNVPTLPWEINNSNVMQIFSRYGRKMQTNCICALILIPLCV